MNQQTYDMGGLRAPFPDSPPQPLNLGGESFGRSVEFLRRVLPAGDFHYYGSLAARPGQSRFWRDYPCPAGKLSSLAENLLRAGRSGHNAYIALSAFRDPRAGRKQNNAAAQKALWLDIDCGRAGCEYADAKAGMAAVLHFLKVTGLPMPLTVISGQGLHLYWTFTQSVTTAAWKNMAARLRVLTGRHGLRVDTTRTEDEASVLRLPGTLNYGKDGQVREVIWFHKGADHSPIELAALLYRQVPQVETRQAKTCQPAVVPPPPATPLHAQLAKVAAGFEDKNRLPAQITRACAQIRRAGQAAYPAWYAMMTVMRHCRGGREAVHLLSRTDRRYSPATVDAKFDECERYAAGPARCDTFMAHDPEACLGCQHRGRISSPVELGDPRLAPPPSTPPMEAPPVGYTGAAAEEYIEPFICKEFRVEPGRGVVWNQPIKNEDGSSSYRQTLINESEVYIKQTQLDYSGPQVRRFYRIQVRSPDRRTEDLTFDVEEHLGGIGMLKWLGHNGLLPIKPKYNKTMCDFMGTYLGAIQKNLPSTEVYSSFGWNQRTDPVSGDRRPGFIIGQRMFLAGETRPVSLAAGCARMAEKEFTYCGELEEWKKIPRMYRVLGQKEAQLFMCAAFAAPLMRFGVGTATNALLSIWDARGGRGKSTLLKVINSVWGHPDEMMCGRSDTTSARFQVMAKRKNLPVCMDELTTMGESELSSLLYDIANGREKRKSTMSGTALADTGQWETVTFITSNRSIYELMEIHSPQTQAESMRVIEIPCTFQSYSGTRIGACIEEIINSMKTNYGLAGPEFMRLCFENPSVFTELPRRVMRWDHGNRQDSEERFWTYSLALILEAGRLAVRFGLLDYDMEALEAWVRDELIPRLRRRVKSEIRGGPGILTSILNAHLDQTVVVASAQRPRGQPGPAGSAASAAGIDSYVLKLPTRTLGARIEMETRFIYVGSTNLARWCAEMRVSTEALLEELQLAGVWDSKDKMRYSLGRDVPVLDMGRMTCYRFAGHALDLDVFDMRREELVA